ncbi:MAG TPA: hypothetical protein VF223_22055, partial [Trebonia sp.]
PVGLLPQPVRTLVPGDPAGRTRGRHARAGARLAIAGLAPGGHLPLLVLTAFAAGLLAIFCTGHPYNAEDRTRPASGDLASA